MGLPDVLSPVLPNVEMMEEAVGAISPTVPEGIVAALMRMASRPRMIVKGSMAAVPSKWKGLALRTWVREERRESETNIWRDSSSQWGYSRSLA